MFINFSNHPSKGWSENQRTAARQYGEIIDIQFPNVEPLATEQQMISLATGYVEEIIQHIGAEENSIVMCQGEFTLTFMVVCALLSRDINVVSAVSERQVIQEVTEGGITEKKVIFEFKGFRKYITI